MKTATLPTRETILKMENIHVFYGNIHALKGVDFDLYRGEIHALVGEHRAGKSTLVKLLSGAKTKESGEIIFKGKKIDSFTPLSAIKNKIGMVYQNINIIPSLNAIENIFAGQMVKKWYGPLNHSAMLERATKLFEQLNVSIDIEAPLRELSQGEQQMVELARVLSFDPELIILDEISNKLTPMEMENIYKIIFEFKKQGRTIIYISHNMDEIFRFADRVTILKDGYRRGTEEINDLDKIKLIELTYSFVMSREKLEESNLNLYFVKKYNENIIKNLPVGVIILDSKNKIYLINFAAINILKIEQHEIIQKDIEQILKKEELEKTEEILDCISKKKKNIWEGITFKQDKILKITVFPFRDNDYSFLGTIVLVEDVSRDYYFKNYLLRTEKIASIAELAAGVAHEINNPLGIISNYIELLKIKQLDKDGKNKLAKIEKELTRIGEIIGSLLSFSKFREPPNRIVDLKRTAEEVIILLNHKLKNKRIKLKTSFDKKPSVIVGDENRIKQLFINLIVNSIEAVLEGGEIQIKIKVEDEFTEFSVTDNGYGIPEEIIDKIFDPFFSTKAGKNNTGLGLSICQHIVEAHNGVITCKSGDRTTFSVRFPLAKSTPPKE